MKKSRPGNSAPARDTPAPQAFDASHEMTIEPTWQAKWDNYWFTPQNALELGQINQVVCVVAALWFISQLSANSFWWGQLGLNAADLAGSLEGFTEGDNPAKFRWTPLWMTNSFNIIAVWCMAGGCLSLLGLMNVGGRWLRGLMTLSILLLAQRLAWGNGILEPYLVALVGYLAIARLSPGDDWSHRFALRLVQVHTWLLLCTSLVSQLASGTWWQGEAVWWLAASNRSTLLVTRWFEDRLMFVNLLTHSITICTAIAIGCLWPWAARPSSWRNRCGIGATLVVAIAYAAVADQILFGCLLAASTLAWKAR